MENYFEKKKLLMESIRTVEPITKTSECFLYFELEKSFINESMWIFRVSSID